MKLVILGRDGVINELGDGPIRTPEQLAMVPGSLEAIARLNHAGHRVVVATNQGAIGRRLLDIEMLLRIHERLLRQLGELGGSVESIFFCPHAPRDRCSCRKPRPGLLNEIARRLRVPLEGVPVVGDELADVEAAREVGARPMLVRTGHGRAVEGQGLQALAGVEVHDDLAAAVEALLGPAGDE